MRKASQLLIGIIIALSLFIFCVVLLVKTLIFNNEAQPKPVESKKVGYTEKEFIKKIAPTAQKISDRYGLYASVMIAQATLESNSGNSELASAPNYNLFGIKGKYKGESVLLPTQEDDGKGNLRTIDAAFRKYNSYEESMKDYATLLKNGTSWNKKFYKKTFKSSASTYQEATEALTGSYATDTKYNKKLNAMIQQYNLQKYDESKN